MLKNFNFDKFESGYKDYKFKELGEELARYQRICDLENIPVVIMLDGWESSGRGYIMNRLVRDLDPKHYNVSIFKNFDKTDDYTYTHNFWRRLPAKGDFQIFDCSMYHDLFNDLSSDEKIDNLRVQQIMRLEKTLYDDHTIIIKFFLHQTKKRQKEAIEEHEKDKYRRFLVSEEDINQNKNYDEYLEHFDTLINQTDFEMAPWNVVSSEDRKIAAKEVMGKTLEKIKLNVERIRQKREYEKHWKATPYNIVNDIRNFDLSKKIDKAEYKKQREILQDEARELAYALHALDIPVVMVFEGMDAAGKGGCISRLIKKIDARSYYINPTSAPSDLEKEHHYLWRFYNNFPRSGYIAIFDRSWYGRVLVERVEGFANDAEWSRAYREINNMERELIESGTIVLKFFLLISKDEQKARFEERQKFKPYKITDEDWRNREKWDDYVLAINEMVYNTDTTYAPWNLISSEDKRYARIEVLKEFNRAAREKIKEVKKENKDKEEKEKDSKGKEDKEKSNE
jgi:polyphosphate:AMP phosphotransferase